MTPLSLSIPTERPTVDFSNLKVKLSLLKKQAHESDILLGDVSRLEARLEQCRKEREFIEAEIGSDSDIDIIVKEAKNVNNECEKITNENIAMQTKLQKIIDIIIEKNNTFLEIKQITKNMQDNFTTDGDDYDLNVDKNIMFSLQQRIIQSCLDAVELQIKKNFIKEKVKNLEHKLSIQETKINNEQLSNETNLFDTIAILDSENTSLNNQITNIVSEIKDINEKLVKLQNEDEQNLSQFCKESYTSEMDLLKFLFDDDDENKNADEEINYREFEEDYRNLKRLSDYISNVNKGLDYRTVKGKKAKTYEIAATQKKLEVVRKKSRERSQPKQTQ